MLQCQFTPLFNMSTLISKKTVFFISQHQHFVKVSFFENWLKMLLLEPHLIIHYFTNFTKDPFLRRSYIFQDERERERERERECYKKWVRHRINHPHPNNGCSRDVVCVCVCVCVCVFYSNSLSICLFVRCFLYL